MLQSVNLRDYMLPDPVRVHPEDNIMDAIKVITDNRISGVCVVDDDANLVGILSEMDCLKAVLGAVTKLRRSKRPRCEPTEDRIGQLVQLVHMEAARASAI